MKKNKPDKKGVMKLIEILEKFNNMSCTERYEFIKHLRKEADKLC